jgi:hypothetical protein
MGMPCEVNSLVKIRGDEFALQVGVQYTLTKAGYRIFALDVPLQLVNGDWVAVADVVIDQLTWQEQTTAIALRVVRVYEVPFAVK